MPIIINIILFVLKVQPNTTYKLFVRKKNKQRCIEKSAIVNRYDIVPQVYINTFQT